MYQYPNRINPSYNASSKQNSVAESSAPDLQGSRSATSKSFKRFTRKNPYGQISPSPVNKRQSFKLSRTQTNGSKNCLQQDQIKAVASNRTSAKNLLTNQNKQSNGNNQNVVKQARTFSEVSISPSLQCSKIQFTRTQFHNQQETENDKKPKRQFLKSITTKSSKLITQVQPENVVEKLRQQDNKLKKENEYFQKKIAYLQQTHEKQNASLKKMYEQKIDKVKKQIDILHSTLMKQQSTCLSLQKKLKDSGSEIEMLKQQRNLFVGQLAKLSRAKLPKQFIDFQSCKEVSLQFQLNQIKNRLNQDKTQVQNKLQQEIHKQEISIRKLQQQINKYEIANRMLLKRAEEAQKFKEAHKNCGVQYKKLKDKYNQTLDQYYQLKKRNIQLLKQNNGSKTKVKDTFSPRNTVSNQNNHSPPAFKKKSIISGSQIEQSVLFDVNLSAIKSSNIFGSKIQSTNNSEMSLQFSLDYSTQFDRSQLQK